MLCGLHGNRRRSNQCHSLLFTIVKQYLLWNTSWHWSGNPCTICQEFYGLIFDPWSFTHLLVDWLPTGSLYQDLHAADPSYFFFHSAGPYGEFSFWLGPHRNALSTWIIYAASISASLFAAHDPKKTCLNPHRYIFGHFYLSGFFMHRLTMVFVRFKHASLLHWTEYQAFTEIAKLQLLLSPPLSATKLHQNVPTNVHIRGKHAGSATSC